MVTLTASGSSALNMYGFNFDRLTDIDSVIVQKSSSSLIIDVDGLRYSFSGSSVRYNGFDEPVAGTITGLTISSGGNTLFQASGFAIPASTFYLSTYYPNSPFSLIFSGDDEMRGGALSDQLVSYGGHDIIHGGDGSDSLQGGDGNDHLYGQSPNGGPDGNDNLSGDGGNDYLQGNAGDDGLFGGDGSDRIQGGQGNDVIRGDAGNDSVNGNLGNDIIDGGADNDSLRGGQGDDEISGGSGNDFLSGDAGIDELTGGAGIDRFVFIAGGSLIGPDNSRLGGITLDTVTDFEHGIDSIAIGFRPAAVMVGTSSYASIDAARSAAQALFDSNPGNAEVAAIQTTYGGTMLLWSSAGGAMIDSAAMFNSQSASSFSLSDFIV